MSGEVFEWHGWGSLNLTTNHHVGLSIGYLPGRKSPALWTNTERGIEALAYFRSDDAARQALAILDDLMAVRHWTSDVSDE